MGVFRQNAEGRWFLSANEHVSAKDLGQRPVDLIETTERTLASYQKMKAGRLPPQLKDYIREVESKSGLTVHPKQRELLVADLRANSYTKLEKSAYDAHKKIYQQPATRDRLIVEWERNTGQAWPTYEHVNKRTGEITLRKYDAHHINPQELGGKHKWWNMHPAHTNAHTGSGGIHSKNSKLRQIVKGAIDDAKQ